MITNLFFIFVTTSFNTPSLPIVNKHSSLNKVITLWFISQLYHSTNPHSRSAIRSIVSVSWYSDVWLSICESVSSNCPTFMLVMNDHALSIESRTTCCSAVNWDLCPCHQWLPWSTACNPCYWWLSIPKWPPPKVSLPAEWQLSIHLI